MMMTRPATCAILTVLIGCSCCFGVLFDRKEKCYENLSCNASSAPEECDNCTGFPGWLTWTEVWTKCSGGTDSDTDCDNTYYSSNYYLCDVEEAGGTEEYDIDQYTYGTVSVDCSCDEGGTKWECEADITVHDEVEVEVIGNYEAEYVRIKKQSSVLINESMVNDTESWTKGGSSTLTLGVTEEITAGQKDVLGVKLGWTVQESLQTNWSNSYSHVYKEEEVGKYGAPFYVQERGKQEARWRKWEACAFPTEWTTGYARRGFSAGTEYHTAASPEALIAIEENAGWLSADTTSLTPE